ncbi:MAG: hypothetical protein RBS87_03855 [Acholeplasma sp.]|jgi:hypothetical protein|nr:hypothetical protein [Acholeplasma sp.]
MKLLITIVAKGKADAVAKIIHQGMIHFQTTMLGVGTAPSEIIDILCMGNPDKEVLFSMIDDQDVNPIFDDLNETLDFTNSHIGVAFTVDVDSIGKLGYDFLYQMEGE